MQYVLLHLFLQAFRNSCQKYGPLCWITHVQFNPVDNEIIMFNHEWPAFDCGIRRINVYDHRQDLIYSIRSEGSNNQENKPYV